MSEFKKYDSDQINLKRVDAKKADGSDSAVTVSELVSGRKARAGATMTPVSMRKKKKLPIVFDIIVAIAMLALVAALVIGSYMLFKYYSNDYKGVDVKYVVACEGENMSEFALLLNEELYCDVEGNTLYFGKVKEVKLEKGNGSQMIILTLELGGVRYRDTEGYFISDERLAVGASFTFRHGEKTVYGTVVELAKADKGGK